MAHQLILLCLLSPAIFAQLHNAKDPNDEPFLPIHPVYPYSPKLIKRGTEAASTSQLTPELYAPKVDAKDSYSTSSNNNHQKDSSYDSSPYSKNNSPSPAYSPYYNNDAHAYANIPYVVYNPYSTPYAVNPASYSSSSYPNYYYQPSYYYPHYFNHAPLSPLPLSGVDYRGTTSQDSTETVENDKQDKDKQIPQSKENETNRDASTSQFVDGGNYISGNLRDLDGQSSTYKIAGPYNQLDVQAKDLPIPLPKTTYRVISVGGQPVGPDYSLPTSYVKVQQMEQLMSQTLSNLLAQKQVGQSYENNKDLLSGVNDGSYANQDAYTPNAPSYVTFLGPRTKAGAAYVINVDGTAKANGERTNLRDSSSPKIPNKDTRHSSVYYIQRPMLQTYASSDIRGKHRDRAINGRPINQKDQYNNYGGIYQSGNKQEQNYKNYQTSSSSYQNKDFTVAPQTPRSYSYEYSAYELGQAQQTQEKINPNNGNFGAKQYNGAK